MIHITFQSVVDVFNSTESTVHCAKVFLKLNKGQLVLLDEDDNSGQSLGDKKLPLVRPSFCPIHSLTSAVIDQLPQETLERGIDSGCSIILESCDGKVLLIRRASHLRTFPGIWTPPGGHVEENETIEGAALREFAEETGLVIKSEDCQNGKLQMLALWESTYPPLLSLGLPIRHHIVVYFYAKMKKPISAEHLDSELKLDPEEVGASVWLDRNIAEVIASTYEDSSVEVSPDIPETVRILVTDRKNQQIHSNLATKTLLNSALLTGHDAERVSTGTKFALSEWLNLTSQC